MDQMHRVVGEPGHFGGRVAIDTHWLSVMTAEERERYQTRVAQTLQRELGTGLVSYIMENGGKAQVDLGLYYPPVVDDRDWLQNILADAYVYPLDRITPHFTVYEERVVQRKVVSHWEYYPADWVCEFCYCIVDGLKHPRHCSQCGGPRTPPKR